MAHVHPKSRHDADHKKEFKLAEHASIATESRAHHNSEVSEAKATKNVSQTSSDADQGGSWQFKFVIGVIATGVLMLILKTIGLF